MKLLPIAATALLAALSACSAPGPEVTKNHWHVYSILPEAEHQFLGYDADRDGSYWNRFKTDMHDLWVTTRQHTLGSVYDPKNPLMGDINKRSPAPTPPPNPYGDQD